VTDLKTLQDWVLQRRFRAVPGVIDVTGWGGKTRQYEVEIDLNKLIASKLTLPQVIQTLSSSNINVGGNTIDIGSQSAVVRGVGLIRSQAFRFSSAISPRLKSDRNRGLASRA
jgi:cobalt-zinc-cadmium resistance protein CzcA